MILRLQLLTRNSEGKASNGGQFRETVYILVETRYDAKAFLSYSTQEVDKEFDGQGLCISAN